MVVNRVDPGFVDNDFDINGLYWPLTGTEFVFEIEENSYDIDTEHILKQARKVRKKQEKVVKMWEKGERNISVITNNLRYRRQMVSYTIKCYKNFLNCLKYYLYLIDRLQDCYQFISITIVHNKFA